MKSLFILSGLIYFTQGIGSLASQPLFYYFRETLGLSVATIMMLGSLLSVPWMIKPLYGWLSDNVPLFGTRRKSYIILSSIVSAMACLCLGLSPFVSLYLLVVLMLLDSIGGAMKDVAVDGLMVQRGKETNTTGTIQSIQWGALSVAQVLTGIAGGYIAQNFSYRAAFGFIAIFPILIAWRAWHEKEPVKTNSRPSTGVFKDLGNPQVLLSMAFLFCLWFSPAFGVPVMDKLVNDLHLSKIWIGWLATIGSFFGLLGAVAYFKLSTKINLQKWLYGGVILSAISTLVYLYLTPTTVLVYNIVFGFSLAFVHLLFMDFMARSCPEGNEALIFSLMCSVVNLGTFCSNFIGGWLFSLVGYNGLVIVSSVFTFGCLAFLPKLKIQSKERI